MGNSSSRNRQQHRPGSNIPCPPLYPQPVYNLGPQPGPYYHPDPFNYGNNWRPAPQYAQFPQLPPGPYPHVPPHGAGAAPSPVVQETAHQTATIRNAVNLKKNTLRLQPLDSNSKALSISFSFDASAPCSVTTYVMASEDPKGCRLVTQKQPPGQPILYDRGLGQKFPRPGNAVEALRHSIDLSLYAESDLTHPKADIFPLVIRLETVTEKGAADGHTLQELMPGTEQKVWVQSQTTFAALVREDDGSWGVKVLKQKIWVEGVSYELQEIYGMTNSVPKSEVAEEDVEERLCVICLVNDRDTTVLPCRHMCMCHECAQELRKQTSKCPICRNHVESLLHIKMQQKNKTASPSKASPKGASEPAR